MEQVSSSQTQMQNAPAVAAAPLAKHINIRVIIKRCGVILAALFILCGLGGCSHKRIKPNSSENSATAHPEIEIENSFEIEREEISKTPTMFEMQYPDATMAWDRAKIFFHTYTSQFKEQSAPVIPNEERVILSNLEATKDPLFYEVIRSPGKQGAKFQVTARVRKNPTIEATAQAQNLARFLRMGTLDQSLLEVR